MLESDQRLNVRVTVSDAPVKSSETGEAWRRYFSGKQLSWCVPDRIQADYFLRHAKSEWISKLLAHTRLVPASNVRILEAGCGTAMFSLSLASLGFAVDAFDYNEEALDFARDLERKARRASPEISVRLHRGNILDIDVKSNTYDLVFNQAVLDYFCDKVERKQALREMMRVARHGKWVAVIVQHTQHPFHKWWRWLGWEGYTNQPPVYAQTPAALVEELKEVGLVNVTVDGIYPWKAFFFHPPWYRHWKLTDDLVYLVGQFLNRFVPLPRALRSTLALQFLVVGQKP